MLGVNGLALTSLAETLAAEVITEPEWAPVGVYDFCRRRTRRRNFE